MALLFRQLTEFSSPSSSPTVFPYTPTEANAPYGSTSGASDFRTLPSRPTFEDIAEARGQSLPPSIDPAVFRGITEIRKLVELASDLAVRAASGLSAAALGALSPSHGSQSLASALGLESPLNNGRTVPMSSTRQHRLRCLAIAKLATAYRIDEVAASVAVMQGATALEDLAEKILKREPTHEDAIYVRFFEERIPSRTLAQSTTTELLDQLIALHPLVLPYYRTRGIVHAYKAEYEASIHDFSLGLSQARSLRKLKQHQHLRDSNGKSQRTKRRGPKTDRLTHFHHEEAAEREENGTEPISPTLNIGIEPGDDIERQLLFNRGMTYLQWASHLIEEKVLAIEGVPTPLAGLSNESGEISLESLGIQVENYLGIYGSANSSKRTAYEETFKDRPFVDKISSLLRKSIRDHEKYLSQFEFFEVGPGSVWEDEDRKSNLSRQLVSDRPLTFRGRRLIHPRVLTGHIQHAPVREDGLNSETMILTSYHPLIVESHFSILLAHLLLGDFQTLLPLHYRTAWIMESLSGVPIFLSARSLCQSQVSFHSRGSASIAYGVNSIRNYWNV